MASEEVPSMFTHHSHLISKNLGNEAGMVFETRMRPSTSESRRGTGAKSETTKHLYRRVGDTPAVHTEEDSLRKTPFSWTLRHCLSLSPRNMIEIEIHFQKC